MAREKITGWTKEEMLMEEHQHPDSHQHDFDDLFCLREIPCQPHDYEGPPRFCRKYTLKKEADGERYSRCRKHNGAGHKNWEKGLEKAGDPEEGNVRAMTHGMYTEAENLKENWSDADQMVFDQVMKWAEDYGFDEGSPEYMQLESLALSKVRELRSEKYLNENEEVVTREQFNPETGESTEWEEVHPLVDTLRLKKQTIVKMMKELGLTPKARSRMDESDAKANEANAVAEIASDALDSDDAEYDPEQFDE